jgi:AcrR family transcriptional regulator
MAKKRRIPAAARREAIIAAVRGVFAEHGFRATTRLLAKAAGVSEALLFQHFPNKEALYDSVLAAFFRDQESEAAAEGMALEPSIA